MTREVEQKRYGYFFWTFTGANVPSNTVGVEKVGFREKYVPLRRSLPSLNEYGILYFTSACPVIVKDRVSLSSWSVKATLLQLGYAFSFPAEKNSMSRRCFFLVSPRF